MQSNLQYIPGGLGDYTTSNAQYVNELASIERRLADIEVQIANIYIDESTRQQMRDEKIRLLARKSAIQQWLSLTDAQKNKNNPMTYLAKKTQSYYNALNKFKNQYEGNNSGSDLFTVDVAGIPLWGIILLVGAGIFLMLGKEK